MSKMLLTVRGDALGLFGADAQKRGGGNNFRIRLTDAGLFIKPSSRTNCVDGEMFGALNAETNSGVFEALALTAGHYGFEKGSRGWLKLNLADVHAEINMPFSFEQTVEEAVATPIVKPAPKAPVEQTAADAAAEMTTAERIAYVEGLDIAPLTEVAPGVLEMTDMLMSGEEACAHLGIESFALRTLILNDELKTAPGNKVVIPVGFKVETATA